MGNNTHFWCEPPRLLPEDRIIGKLFRSHSVPKRMRNIKHLRTDARLLASSIPMPLPVKVFAVLIFKGDLQLQTLLIFAVAVAVTPIRYVCWAWLWFSYREIGESVVCCLGYTTGQSTAGDTPIALNLVLERQLYAKNYERPWKLVLK